jgi:CRP-like cAMP-binding protein
MIYLSKSFAPEVIEEMVSDFLNKRLSLATVSEKYRINYDDLRNILRSKFQTKYLLRYRNEYRAKEYGEITRKKAVTKASAVVPIVVSLLTEKEMNYVDIANVHGVCRERVSQIAERVAQCGVDVARSKNTKRGKAA